MRTNACLASISLVGALAGAIAMSSADAAWASSFPRVVARAHIQARHGGTLRYHGVRLRVPRHVMKRSGRVEIVQESRYGFDFQIHAPWRGTVSISFPLRSNPPLIAHRQLGGWIIEPAKMRHGRAVIHVRHLSLISDLWTCIKKKSPSGILECLALKGVRRVPLSIIKKVLGRDYDPCLPVGPGNVSIDPIQILTSSCGVGETPVPNGPGTPIPLGPLPPGGIQGSSPPLQGGPSPTPTPEPTPEPTPPPQPTPQPPARSIQIGWSGAHPGWIWMTLNGFSVSAHQYTCAFASGGDATFTLSESTSPQTWDNGHTCYDLIHGDTVWVVVEGVASNSIRVP